MCVLLAQIDEQMLREHVQMVRMLPAALLVDSDRCGHGLLKPYLIANVLAPLRKAFGNATCCHPLEAALKSAILQPGLLLL